MHPVVIPVKPCNFTNIRLRHWCFLANFLKLFGMHFDALLEFSKSSQNTGKKIFAKYLSANGCFVKTNTILTLMLTATLSFAFSKQLMKRNFTWSSRAIHLRSSSVFLCRLKLWFAKKLKMNLRITPTDSSFRKYWDHAKILIVFKRWCNCLILCEIIFQLEILRD